MKSWKLVITITNDENWEATLGLDAKETTIDLLVVTVEELLPKLILEMIGKMTNDKWQIASMTSKVMNVIGWGKKYTMAEVKVSEIPKVSSALKFAVDVANKFIAKVESGKAHSKETYQDMKDLVEKIKQI